jgi:hypothetical protein
VVAGYPRRDRCYLSRSGNVYETPAGALYSGRRRRSFERGCLAARAARQAAD